MALYKCDGDYIYMKTLSSNQNVCKKHHRILIGKKKCVDCDKPTLSSKRSKNEAKKVLLAKPKTSKLTVSRKEVYKSKKALKLTDKIRKNIEKKYGKDNKHYCMANIIISGEEWLNIANRSFNRGWDSGRKELIEKIREEVENQRGNPEYSTENFFENGTCIICHTKGEHLEACDYAIYRQRNYALEDILSILKKI